MTKGSYRKTFYLCLQFQTHRDHNGRVKGWEMEQEAKGRPLEL